MSSTVNFYINGNQTDFVPSKDGQIEQAGVYGIGGVAYGLFHAAYPRMKNRLDDSIGSFGSRLVWWLSPVIFGVAGYAAEVSPRKNFIIMGSVLMVQAALALLGDDGGSASPISLNETANQTRDGQIPESLFFSSSSDEEIEGENTTTSFTSLPGNPGTPLGSPGMQPSRINSASQSPWSPFSPVRLFQTLLTPAPTPRPQKRDMPPIPFHLDTEAYNEISQEEGEYLRDERMSAELPLSVSSDETPDYVSLSQTSPSDGVDSFLTPNSIPNANSETSLPGSSSESESTSRYNEEAFLSFSSSDEKVDIGTPLLSPIAPNRQRLSPTEAPSSEPEDQESTIDSLSWDELVADTPTSTPKARRDRF